MKVTPAIMLIFGVDAAMLTGKQLGQFLPEITKEDNFSTFMTPKTAKKRSTIR